MAHADRRRLANEGDFISDRATKCRVKVAGSTYTCTPREAEGGITVRCVRKSRSVRFFNSGG